MTQRARKLDSIPPPEAAFESRARIEHLSSHVAEIKKGLPLSASPDANGEADVVPRAMPTGWSRSAHILVEIAVHYVVIGDLKAARREALDALVLLDLEMIDSHDDAGCELSLMLGDVLLATDEAILARDRFQRAADAFDERGDRRSAARARVGLARALTLLADPAARAVLEDAGTAFEDLGDEEAVRTIDVELRALCAKLGEESPTSFHRRSSPRE